MRAGLRRAFEAGRASVRAGRGRESGERDDDPDDDELETPAPPAAKQPILTHPSTVSRDDADVPHGLRIAAAWAWRLLVIGVVAFYLIKLVGNLRIVIIPLVVALLLSALLAPAVRLLLRAGVPRSLATGVVLVAGLAAVVGTITLVVNQFINGLPDLSENVTRGIRQIQDWLRDGPMNLSDDQLDQAVQAAEDWLNTNSASLTSTTISTATTLFEIITGILLVLFSMFFFLRDGRKIWRFMVRLLPTAARSRVADAGSASWATLVAYVRATVLVAFIDAVGIGLALVLLNVPFAFPLAALVFLGAFVPIVGATLSGTVAVLIALVDEDGGLVKALLVLAAVILVQQLEGHVLQPLIMGKAVAIHPLAVIVAIAAGVVLAGIVGALIAVPLVAVLNTGIRRLASSSREPPPDSVVVRSTAP
ncbi:MAG TPA: AI-2E family transporter [Micromonosporaceae bacterium]|nr:AI-2E family transporter [Micromonosporaceae bacterium]